jgi:hypothetical protein
MNGFDFGRRLFVTFSELVRACLGGVVCRTCQSGPLEMVI